MYTMISGEAQKQLDGFLGFLITQKIPGTPSYYKNARLEILSTAFHRAPPTFFITISALPSCCDDLASYLKKVWQFKDVGVPDGVPVYEYDVNFILQFILQKFRAIRLLFTAENPSFWGVGKFDLCVTSTEFQLRGLPHWHLLVWLDMPWSLRDLNRSSPLIWELLKYYDDHISTDASVLDRSFQTHTHVPKRCFKKNRRRCRFDFPRIPLLSSTIAFPPQADEEVMPKHVRLRMMKDIRALLNSSDSSELTAHQFYDRLNIPLTDVQLLLGSTVTYP